MSIPPLREVREYFFNNDQSTYFSFFHGLLYNEMNCPRCLEVDNIERAMSISDSEREMWRCKTCYKKVSIRKDSIFSHSHLSIGDILLIMYAFTCKIDPTIATDFCGNGSATINDYYKMIRKGLADGLTEEQLLIGGEGIVVEIDESKFTKRKYNRGRRRVLNDWVLGGIERTEEGKVFLVPVATRDAATLKQVITTYVRPGSIIITDCWASYNWIDEDDEFYQRQHLTVNHSLHFTDPLTGATTNTIEGTWTGVKDLIPPKRRRQETLGDNLFEYIWRKQNRNSDNLFLSLVQTLANVNYE